MPRSRGAASRHRAGLAAEAGAVVLVLVFGLVLLVTVALSGLAARSVLSTALVFLVGGALVGPGALGLVEGYGGDARVA